MPEARRVYSNQPEVELLLNGVSLGTVQSDNHVFVFEDIFWADGANVVNAIATTATDTVTWQR